MRTGATTTARRSAACRTSAARAPGSRSATADGSACPHLITAALLLAGLDGIERELDAARPGRRRRLPARRRARGLDAARRASATALDALEADTVLTERLGAQLVSTFLAMKRFEVERFTEAVGELDVEVVSEWEIEEYAAHL